MIYEHVFDGSISYKITGLVHPEGLVLVDVVRDEDCPYDTKPKAMAVCLLRTCRQVYSELWHWLRENHTVDFNIGLIDYEYDPPHFGLDSLRPPSFFKTFQLTIHQCVHSVRYLTNPYESNALGQLWRQLSTFIKTNPGCQLTLIECQIYGRLVYYLNEIAFVRGLSSLGLYPEVLIVPEEANFALGPGYELLLDAKTSAAQTMLRNARKCKCHMCCVRLDADSLLRQSCDE